MFRPKPGQILHLGEHRYRVLPHPISPAFPYGQEGRMAVVYKLERELLTGQTNSYRAFKVFKASYRTPQIEIKAKELKQFGKFPGLQAAIRRVISPNNPIYHSLLAVYPDLAYSVLMPWVPGQTWSDIMQQKRPLSREQAWTLAWNVLYILRELEKRQMAHCDLAAANIMIDWRGSNPVVSLVDVEQLYAPGLTPPESLLVGSPGYMPQFDQEKLWGPLGDRFAGAILLSELLAWYHPDVIQHGNEQSFFTASEIHQTSERYQLMRQALRGWGDVFEELFLRAWHASSLEECPSFQIWEQAFRGEITSLEKIYTTRSAAPPMPDSQISTLAYTDSKASSPEVELAPEESATIHELDRQVTEQDNAPLPPTELPPKEAEISPLSAAPPKEVTSRPEDQGNVQIVIEDNASSISSSSMDINTETATIFVDVQGSSEAGEFVLAENLDSTQSFSSMMSQNETEIIDKLAEEIASPEVTAGHTQIIGLEAIEDEALETSEQTIKQLWDKARRALQRNQVPTALQLYNEAINLGVQKTYPHLEAILNEYNKIIFEQIAQSKKRFYHGDKLDRSPKSMTLARRLGYWLGGLAPEQLIIVLIGFGFGAGLLMYLIHPLINAPSVALFSLGTALLAMLLPMFQKPPVVTAIYSIAIFMGWVGNSLASTSAEKPRLFIPLVIGSLGAYLASKGIEQLKIDVYKAWEVHMLWSTLWAMLIGILIDEMAYPSYTKLFIEAFIANFLVGITFWYIGDQLREAILAFREAASR